VRAQYPLSVSLGICLLMLSSLKTSHPYASSGGCLGIFETYFVHNLSSAANCDIISATRFLFSGPSF
jgi:hypothetical protein